MAKSMILSMSGQAWLFLSTVLMGAAVGLFYDVFRIFRKTVPHKTIAVQLEDLFFWIVVTAGVFYFMLHRNFGEIRMFSFIGAGIGILLYFATISRYVIIAFVAVIDYMKKVVMAALRIIFWPLRVVLGWISPPFVAFFRKRRLGLRRVSRYGRMRMRKTARDWFIVRHKK